MDVLTKVMSLLDQSHSVFHAVALMKGALFDAGFREYDEKDAYKAAPGSKFFITRNGSSIIAFSIPKNPVAGLRIAATHNDSPTFVLKPNPVLVKGGVTMLNTEPYGGALYAPWLDRPLSFAGRIYVQKEEKAECVLVDVDEDILIIPSLAIHMDREANKGHEYNAAKDMVPLWMDHAYQGDFKDYLKKKLNIEGEILSYDLALYVREKAKLIGEGGDLLLSPRLDDLSSAYANLLAFLEASKKEEGHIAVFASFDNEEVGSLTAQGAHSDFFRLSLDRVMDALGYSVQERAMNLAESILLSVDNAHANHPNHPEKSDATTNVSLNGGIVLKYNANQLYTTSGPSGAYVKGLAKRLGQDIQEFTNRSDLRGGSTLGNLSNAEVSILSADIGIAQLAMHSCVELCGAEDVAKMMRLLEAHYRD